MHRTTPQADARTRIPDAALMIIREKGHAATRVDDIRAEAGQTKGGFFHHFKGKEDMAVAAAEHWSEVTGGRFAHAPYHDHADPLDRVLAYVAFREAILQGAFILAKARGGPETVREMIDHLDRYIRLLFGRTG